MNEYYEEPYNEIDELEAERRMLVNEELQTRINLERNLNKIAGYVVFTIFARIGIVILIILLFLFGFLKFSL